MASGRPRVRGMRMRTFAAVAVLALFAGCTATGATGGNFDLEPERIGWYAGERARFMLNITPSLTKQAPDYTIDRNFAIEEIRYEERGASFGGDYETRNPDDVGLVLRRGAESGEEFILNAETPGLDLYLDVPANLRDSEYVLELKLFEVGWVKSEPFRVDQRALAPASTT